MGIRNDYGGGATAMASGLPGASKGNVRSSYTYNPDLVKQRLAQPTISPNKTTQPKQSTSIFSRVKNVVKGAVEGAKTTGEKAFNTVAAGTAGSFGVEKAGVQALTGNRKGAKQTLQSAQKTTNNLLDKGVGGKGAYVTSKQAASRGTGVKGLVNDTIKPIAQGATDITPYVLPAGKAAEGASLLVKAGKAAAGNALVSGATTAANEAIQGRLTKDNGGEIAKSVAVGAALGAGGSLLHAGVKEGAAQLSTKEAKNTLLNTKVNTLLSKAQDKEKPTVNAAPSHIVAEAEANRATQNQVVSAQAAEKQQSDAIATAEKNQEQGQKVDRQIELIQAKAKDSETGLSNVDKTKLGHLKEDKQQLGTGTNGTPITTVKQSEQPIASVEATTTPTPEPSRATAVEPTAPERGVSKVAQSIQEKAVARGLKNDFGEAGGYDKFTIADQSAKAVKVANDRPLLDSIINGEKPLPDGLRATALIKAVEEHPVLGKDSELINRLSQAEHLTGESSRSAQELRLAAERAPHSPVEAIRQVRKARADAVERKTGKTVAKATSDELKAIRAAKATVPKPTKETFASFVDSLRC